MTHEGLPVPGYRTQSDEAVEIVSENKLIEERLLRQLDAMLGNALVAASKYDGRWLAIARTHFEQGFMALNRAVFRPGRVTLPEDR